MSEVNAPEAGKSSAQEQQPLPWYSLNPRALSKSRIFRAILIALVVCSFSIAPLWRLLWYYPIYSARNFVPVQDISGKQQQAWRWVEGKEIRIYQLPEIRAGRAEVIASGVDALLYDANLDFTVRVLPPPPSVLKAYQESLVEKTVNGTRQQCLDFQQLEARLIALRAHDPHADMLVVNAPIADCWWAHGMAVFNSGVSVLQEDFVSLHLGKHESCHLLGYQYHDSFPLFVVGYPWEGSPWTRDTLMMINGQSDEQSPRAHDALQSFWRGMEKRLGTRFLRTTKVVQPSEPAP